MRPEPVEPTVDADGEESHPSWALIGVSRVMAGGKGVPMFDSDVRHNNFVVLRVQTATRKRDLHRDWIHSDKLVMEIEMSEVQYASMISTMNSGDGVPATLRYVRDGKLQEVPPAPFDSRLEQTHTEVTSKTHETFGRIEEAWKVYKAKPNAANRRELELAIQNASSNIDYAAKSLTEHAEAVVQKARADIEAMVVNAEQLQALGSGDTRRRPAELEGGES